MDRSPGPKVHWTFGCSRLTLIDWLKKEL